MPVALLFRKWYSRARVCVCVILAPKHTHTHIYVKYINYSTYVVGIVCLNQDSGRKGRLNVKVEQTPHSRPSPPRARPRIENPLPGLPEIETPVQRSADGPFSRTTMISRQHLRYIRRRRSRKIKRGVSVNGVHLKLIHLLSLAPSPPKHTHTQVTGVHEWFSLSSSVPKISGP